MSTLEILDDITKKIITQNAVVSAAIKAASDNQASILEFQRQINYHNSMGNTQDAENVAVRLTDAYSKQGPLDVAVSTAKSYLDNLNNDLQATKQQLTPEEKLVAVNNSTIALNQSNQQLLATQAEVDKKT